MKKFVLTMTLIAGVVASAMTLSAFTKPTKTESVIEITASPVWEGWVTANGAYGEYERMHLGGNRTRIRVYPTDNSCGAYYAVTLYDGYQKEDSIHYTVKSNPSYDYKSRKQDRVEYYSHYITIGSQDYFFRM